MKKRKERLKVLSLALVLGLLAVGCGSGSKGGGSSYASMAYDTAAAAEPAEGYSGGTFDGGAYQENGVEYAVETSVQEEMEVSTESSESAPAVQDIQRKLIKNVNLEVETETFEDLLAAVEEKTGSLGGYIEESYTYNGSSYYGRGNRNANLTIRIPAERLNEFLSSVSEQSNVISRNESVTDVTLQYVDMESHKKALLAEQKRLLELLEKAETIEDIISLESRLSEVRYQIESMESRLRAMDNQVSYSTVYLNINEVTKYTPVKEQSPWEKITAGFANSLANVGNGLIDFGIGFIISLPYIILWAVIIAVVLLVTMLIIKHMKKKKQQKQEKKQKGFASGQAVPMPQAASGQQMGEKPKAEENRQEKKP